MAPLVTTCGMAISTSQDWFNDYLVVKGTALRQMDFRGTLGGPVRVPGLCNGKDKTFLFVSYEGLPLISPEPASTSITFVPDAALRSAVAAPFKPVLNAFAVPSGPDDTTNGFVQYIASWSNPSSLDSASVRFNHVVYDKLRLLFRFSDTTSGLATQGVSRASSNGLNPNWPIPGGPARMVPPVLSRTASITDSVGYKNMTEALNLCTDRRNSFKQRETGHCDQGWFGGTRR